MDCQGLVVRLIQDFVLLTTAVEVAQRWRELAEKLAKVSKQQMDAYESPHRDRNGVVDSEVSRALGASAPWPGCSSGRCVRVEPGDCVRPGMQSRGLSRNGPGGGCLLTPFPGGSPNPTGCLGTEAATASHAHPNLSPFPCSCPLGPHLPGHVETRL